MAHMPKILIINFGSQYTLKIEQVGRKLGVRSVVLEPGRAEKFLAKYPVDGIILSGGFNSVYDEDAPKPPESIFSARREDGSEVPILGICYGMHWLAKRFGGVVESVHELRGYGHESVGLASDPLFTGLPHFERLSVWASHGDSVTIIPNGFHSIGATRQGGIAAMANKSGTAWGVQFHPEVEDTQFGMTILENFIIRICGAARDWQPRSIIDSVQSDVLEALAGRDMVMGFSGGVDSTTMARILSPVLGKRLRCLTIDAGQFRQNELWEVMRHAEAAGVHNTIATIPSAFLDDLAGVVDAEETRAVFKVGYHSALMHFAHHFPRIAAVGQGTLAPDVIESGGAGGDLIKSHHNWGLNFAPYFQLHPFRNLFKNEVRELAKLVGLPESICDRQPFPGPGLFIRIFGIAVTAELLELVRWADAAVKEILLRHQLYQDISQLIVAYCGTPTVCVKGDKRVYTGSIFVRAFQTVDFMTGKGIYLPEPVWREIESTLIKHPLVGRAVPDTTPKPPGTAEYQ